MTIHVVVPVFNRLGLTQELVSCLRRQVLNHPLRILIVNDGSTDGTADWLSAQNDIDFLSGDGSLFWGGAVDLAVRHLMARAEPEDWILLMNNDTTVSENFVQCLLDTALQHAPAAIGSVIRSQAHPHTLLSIGANVDAWRLVTRDILDSDAAKATSGILGVDALSGRGVLFPLKSLSAAGGMRPSFLPHYMADYEVSVRVRKSGWRLLIQPEAVVYSEDDYGSMRDPALVRERFFSVRSPFYLPANIVFWWEASNWLQRLTLPIRLPLFIFFPQFRKPA